MVKMEVGSHCNGKYGEDLYIKVPIGTVVKDAKTNNSVNKKSDWIYVNMEKQNENVKFKIICVKAPKWLSFILKRLVKNRG